MSCSQFIPIKASSRRARQTDSLGDDPCRYAEQPFTVEQSRPKNLPNPSADHPAAIHELQCIGWMILHPSRVKRHQSEAFLQHAQHQFLQMLRAGLGPELQIEIDGGVLQSTFETGQSPTGAGPAE
jgi:hypothetical protein